MDNFKAVYRILSEPEKALDYEQCDISKFSHRLTLLAAKNTLQQICGDKQ